MRRTRRLFFWGEGACLGCFFSAMVGQADLVFSCVEGNDLYRTVKAAGLASSRCAAPSAAVEQAKAGDGVLILADGYPAHATALTADLYAAAARKGIRVYVEYPSMVPGVAVLPAKTMRFERSVVSSDFFGDRLPERRILAINGLRLLPVKAEKPHLVAARVAGFDTAVYGLPAETYPLLFEPPGGGVLVATAQFSRFITARYAPQDAWQAVWRAVLGWLQPGAGETLLKWEPAVRPAYGRDEALPSDVERLAVRRGAEWFFKAKLFPDAAQPGYEWQLSASEIEQMEKGVSVSTGLFGIREGLLSVIQPDGNQAQLNSRRGDCTAESAMALAFGGRLMGDARQTAVAKNLLDFYLFRTIACKRERGDPTHGAYGLIAWGIDNYSLYRANYGDDNARLLFGVLATASLTGEDRWDETVMRCLLGNLRTSGRFGYRGSRIDLPELSAQGWQPFFKRDTLNYAAHFECYLWACYLWAYHKTGFEPFYDRAETAIRMMMAQYTDGWRWTNGLSQEKARMLLPLSWLVQVKDTPEHRAWLRKAVDGVIALQAPCGAIREEIGLPGKGAYPPCRSNEDYGKYEASLIQENGDPVADLLYTANFAFLGLHEAAAVGDEAAKRAEGKLAEFLCRIQVRSEAHPSVDGGWFRAFDFGRWESWASNADAGWGAWCIESGWTQGWIVSVLAMRQMNVSLWGLTADSRIARHFGKQRALMLPDEALAACACSSLQHLAREKPLRLNTAYAKQYSGGGNSALTDGNTGRPTHTDRAWQGYHGVDLDAVIDLETPVASPRVAVTFLQEIPVGIYMPTQVVFSVSTNGLEFVAVKTVSPGISETNAAVAVRTVSARLDGTVPRYVRVQARTLGKIPTGMRSAGQPAWLFADEIVIKREEK